MLYKYYLKLFLMDIFFNLILRWKTLNFEMKIKQYFEYAIWQILAC